MKLLTASDIMLDALKFIVNCVSGPGEDAELTATGYNKACAAILAATVPVEEQEAEPPENPPNTDILEGMACPVCRSTGPFEIAFDSVHLVHDRGAAKPLNDGEWDNASYCGCRQCSHSGVVGDFQLENQGKLRHFTVVGVYADNSQPYCDHVEAVSPEQAAKSALAWSVEGDLRILCVFEGKHMDVVKASDADTGHVVGEVYTLKGDEPQIPISDALPAIQGEVHTIETPTPVIPDGATHTIRNIGKFVCVHVYEGEPSTGDRLLPSFYTGDVYYTSKSGEQTPQEKSQCFQMCGHMKRKEFERYFIPVAGNVEHHAKCLAACEKINGIGEDK